MSGAPLRLLLGPQRPEPNLFEVMQKFGLDADPIGVISAGWQEAEGDIDVLRETIACPLENLAIYQRAETLFASDSVLHLAHRARQERLKEQQRLYRMRLRHLKVAVRQTLRAEGVPSIIAAERRHAISQLRALDRHHLRQIQKTHTRFEGEINSQEHPELVEQQQQAQDEFARYSTIMITGGNLLVLLNRLRLFGIDKLLADKALIAWSAGAMLLGGQLVLFHDRLPQGRRDAEVVDHGLNLLTNTIILPDARNRLRTGNTVRMTSLARRMAPASCHTLNNGSFALYEGDQLVNFGAVDYITRSGQLKQVSAT